MAGISQKDFHAVSLSGGKDSTAMLLLMIEQDMPIDMVLYADTGMEFPEMYDHIAKLDAYLYEQRGIHITVLRHPKGFEYLMFDEPKVKPRSIENRLRLGVPLHGNGWPGIRVRWCTGALKTKLIDKEVKRLKGELGAIHYIGIAYDEAWRCKGERYNVKADITPYFETHPIMLPELSADTLSAFFAYERNENKVPVQILLELHEALLVGLGYAVELGWISENPVEKVNPCENDSQLLFTQFLLDWLAMMKKSVAITTHSGYTKSIKGHIIPYFDAKHPGLKLSHVTPKHIQDYYTYEMEERGLSANTILRRQANIRKALQYAYKTGLISGNPADKIERPKAEKYTGTFYQADELNSLFQAFRNDPLELVVILATYYGLRRSEIIGLRWDAIDFEKKTLTVKHTVHQANIDGKWQIVALDRTKTKSSFRTLPLVGPIENLLLQEKARQQQNRRLCGTCYCTEFSEYIFVNDIGELIKPDFVSRHFALIVQKHNLKKLRFHDLRHSCASLLFANGVSMKEIQAWLGHSTLGTTANIYTHMDEDKKLDSANAIMPVLKF